MNQLPHSLQQGKLSTHKITPYLFNSYYYHMNSY